MIKGEAMKISKDILKAYVPKVVMFSPMAVSTFMTSHMLMKRRYEELSKYLPMGEKLLERMRPNNYRRMHGLPLKRRTLKRRRFGKWMERPLLGPLFFLREIYKSLYERDG